MNAGAPDNARLASAFDTVKMLQAATEEMSAEHVVEVLQVLPRHYRETGGEIEMLGVRGAPDWLAYELRLWELSEVIRTYLKLRRGIRGRCALLDVVTEIVTDARYGKGRQNFVLVLAEYGAGPYLHVIGGLLDDPEVCGHAVKGLTKLKEPGYAEKVESILSDSKVAWIRAAARKYLKSVRP